MWQVEDDLETSQHGDLADGQQFDSSMLANARVNRRR